MSLQTQQQQQQAGDVKKDQWGYLVHTSSVDCINYVNDFYYQVLIYGSHKKVILQAVAEDEGCVLANALAAWYMMGVNPSNAARYLATAKQNAEKATDYERSVLEAITRIVEGRISESLSWHSELLEKFPRDLVSLKRAQMLCFAMGKLDGMFQFASQVLPHNVDSAYMHGVLAFALIELGRTDEAEAAARKALSIEKHDIWAQHALCHVFQERQQFKQAVLFMESNSESWRMCGSFLYSHNWWHLAICHLESGQEDSLESALNVFDTHIWGDRERGEKDISQVSLNALGLLLFMEVKGFGEYITERVSEVAKCLVHESKWHKEWLLDLLVVWALARCSYLVEAKQLVSNLSMRVHALSGSKEVHRSILALASALYEYGTGNEKAVSSLLGPAFNTYELKVIGASNEQIRVFGQIWHKTKLT